MNLSHQLAITGLVAIGILLDAGCAGSPQQCSDGMTQLGSACVLGAFPCTDGTKLNPETNACEIDPTACRSGTVLVNHQCVDPTAGLTVDLEEAAEPNGLVEFKSEWPPRPFAVLESNWQSAGAINLRPAGDPGVVIHGCVVPTAIRPADFDGYTISVDRPTLLHVSADGVNGLSAGFFFVADFEPLPADVLANPSPTTWYNLREYLHLKDWLRVGLSAVSDSAQREVYLPQAGRYRMFVTDSRTLIPLTTAWSDVFTWTYTPEPVGIADGTGCYYVTVEQRNVPPPTRLDLDAGDSGTITGDIKFYTADFGDGFTGVSAKIDSTNAKVAFMLFNNGRLRQLTYDQGPLLPGREQPGQLFFGGIMPGDTPLLVLDHQYVIGDPDYRVDVYVRVPALPLPAAGGTIVSTLKGTAIEHYPPPHYWPTVDPLTLNMFYFDVKNAGDLIGMKLQFSLPVLGHVYDGDLWTTVSFTGDRTFTDYQGLVRSFAPGRNYFWLVGPRNTVGDAFSVTSTYAPVTPAGRFTVDAPSGSIALDSVFRSTVMEYDPRPGASWQLFNATGTDMTDVVTTVFDPARIYGRLDTLMTTDENGTPAPDDPLSIANLSFPETGAAPSGYVVHGMPNPLWIKVHASAPGPNPAFNLDFKTRQIARNFNLLTAPSTTTLSGETLSAVAPNSERRYFFSAPKHSIVTITATPTSGFRTSQRRLMIASLNRDESDNVVFDSPTAGPEIARYRLILPLNDPGDGLTGYTAFVVRPAQPAGGTYDLTIKVEPPFYSRRASPTQFTDACSNGNVLAMTADGSVDGDNHPRLADDEGLSAPIATPAGFQFYGASVADLVVSTNGFVSFDPTITSASWTFGVVPDSVGKMNVAPYVGELNGMTICTRRSGTSLTIQWTGFVTAFWHEYSAVQFQLVLNAADQSMEFVFGPGHAVSDPSDYLASGGVQDTTGLDGTQTFAPYESTNRPMPNTAIKLTHP